VDAVTETPVQGRENKQNGTASHCHEETTGINCHIVNNRVFNHFVSASMLVPVLVVLLAGCTPAQPRPDEQEVAGFLLNTSDFQLTGSVDMKVYSNGTRLKIENAANKQCKFAKQEEFQKGCFVVPEGYTARITFKLADQDKEDYFIRSFRICPWTAADQQADKKPNLSCTLSNPVRVEYWVAEGNTILHPDINGVLTLASQPDSFDLNDNNAIQGDYFYWVEVCPNGALHQTACPSTDPGSRNGGK
jgi:hypothetical protein